MKLIEIQTNVNKNGEVTVPKELMQDMGFAPGNKVKLSFVSESIAGIRNTFNEFVITTDGVASILQNNEEELTLPGEILEKAGIPHDSDIEVICTEGAVVIVRADLTSTLPDELQELFEEFGIGRNTVHEVIKMEVLSNE